jgi:hypothetical protein
MSLLAGIRVVEMGLWVAGPSAGGILADWGAEVVKLEMPSGDPMRSLYSAMSGSKESRCPPFDLHNRGKRSIALDVNKSRGLELAQKLIATADVFLTNMRPQFLKRAQLDHDTLLAAHPKLVYGILTGYGLEGPDKDAPGFDLAAFSARSGLIQRATAPGGEPPTLPGGPAQSRAHGPRPARLDVAAAHGTLLREHGADGAARAGQGDAAAASRQAAEPADEPVSRERRQVAAADRRRGRSSLGAHRHSAGRDRADRRRALPHEPRASPQCRSPGGDLRRHLRAAHAR